MSINKKLTDKSDDSGWCTAKQFTYSNVKNKKRKQIWFSQNLSFYSFQNWPQIHRMMKFCIQTEFYELFILLLSMVKSNHSLPYMENIFALSSIEIHIKINKINL